ncbi:MAG: DNA-3-methyladenine glycosylase [Bacteroidales bacterium]
MKKGEKISESYYLQSDVVHIARDLLGKVLCTSFEGQLTTGMITETEAYKGINDKASHAYGGKMTNRNSIMYQQGGVGYIYLCYGVHSLFNVVTNIRGIPDAVLIRGIYPLLGIEFMKMRQGKNQALKLMGSGPGKVSTLLGFHYTQSGISLTGETSWLEDVNISLHENIIKAGPRIGVDYAGLDASLPYRFLITDPEQYII